MTPLDPILRDHEKRMTALEAARRRMEDDLIVMDAIQRRHAANMEAFEDFIAQQIEYEMERDRKHEDWKAHHELAMKEFDDKLNGLIAWLDDFVRRNPKNGK